MIAKLLGSVLLLAVAASGPACAADITALTAPLAAVATADAPVVKITVDGQTRDISLADIEKLPLKQTTLATNWGTKGTWQGVLLADLAAAYGMGASRQLHLLALDDYAVDLSMGDIRSEQAFLATRFEGKPIPLEEKGPVLLLWPTQSEAALSGTASLANWIWSIVEMTAKN